VTITTALIDGDVFAYRVAAASETVIDLPNGGSILEADPLEAASKLDDTLGEIADKLGATRSRVALTVGRCFRYDVLPTYKHNRRDVRRPILLRGLKDHLVSKWGAKIKEGLEADDTLGIWATMPSLKGKKVIVSIDKDLKQIPGWFYNPMHSETAVRVSEEAGDRFHMMQTLMGDVTDGYKGCPGIGPKKATAVLELTASEYEMDVLPHSWWWPRIVKTYESKGLTEADALVQARVARICRATDFDFERNQPILWSPPSA
jgi:DNA polymerase-1